MREVKQRSIASTAIESVKSSSPRSLASNSTSQTQGPFVPKVTISPSNTPAEFPGYKIVKELGRGGMGVVYLAKNIEMDRLEVLKVLNDRLLNHPGAEQRFRQEIRMVSKLNHPNIVTSYNFLRTPTHTAFAMEYVQGTDLQKYIGQHKQLPIHLACSLARQIAFGLQHAHEKKLVHRDIKPSNAILYKADGQLQLKILDFGLAKATSEKGETSNLTQDGTTLGTPEYMAPEQMLNAAKADIRADIYSLGCTLYHMLAGHPPFRGTQGEIMMAHAQREAPMVNLLRSDVPRELAALIAKMMAKGPNKRFQSPTEVMDALLPYSRKISLPLNSPSARSPNNLSGLISCQDAPSVEAECSGIAKNDLLTLTHFPIASPGPFSRVKQTSQSKLKSGSRLPANDKLQSSSKNVNRFDRTSNRKRMSVLAVCISSGLLVLGIGSWFRNDSKFLVPERIVESQKIPNDLNSIADGIQGPPVTSMVESSNVLPLQNGSPVENVIEEIQLNYITDIDDGRWSLNYWDPRDIALSQDVLPNDWILPRDLADGSRALWAVKHFGSTTTMNLLAIVPQAKKVDPWLVFISFDGSKNFTDIEPIPVKHLESKDIDFSIAYKGEQKQPYRLSICPVASQDDMEDYISTHRRCAKGGTIALPEDKFKILLSDDNANGLYSDPKGTCILIAKDDEMDPPQWKRCMAESAIRFGTSRFLTAEISDDGSRVRLRPAKYGVLEGVVHCPETQSPVEGATVRVRYGGFHGNWDDLETTTDEAGRYSLHLPTGRVTSVRVTAPRYVPNHIFMYRKELWISESQSSNLDATLDYPTNPMVGSVKIPLNTSYHFLTGKQGTGVGDFEYGMSGNRRVFGTYFPEMQNGVIDLGPLKTPLELVIPPLGGYRSGIEAKVGHIYVSKARDGEFGSHIIFKVTEISDDNSCSIEYFYRQSKVHAGDVK